MTFKHWQTLIACSIGTFLLLVHTTAATVSVTAIERDLQAGFADGQWVINGYSLAVGAFLLAAGTVGDVVGHRHVFTVGMIVFTLGTAGCALAPTAGVLIAARVVQGLGGAAILAAMIPLIVHNYTGKQRGTALAVWSVCSAIGGTVGTLGSGVFAHPGLWRWLFIASLPFAVAAVVIGFVVTTELPDDGGRRRRLDVAGTAWTMALVGSATFAITAAGEFGTASGWTIGAIALALASFLGLAVTERRVMNPALPPALFRSRQFVSSIATSFAYYLAAFGPLPAMAVWLTHSGGLDATTAADLLAVQQVGFILVAALIRVSERHHAAVLALGMTAIILGVLLAATLVILSLPAMLMLVPLVLSGGGAGLVTPVLPHRATEAAPPSLAGAAAGTVNTMRQFGLAVGVAACSAVAQTLAPASNGAGTALALFVAATVAVAGLITQLALRDSTGSASSTRDTARAR